MSRSVLQSILGDAVYQSLSSEIKNALEDYLGLKNNAITNLEAEIQKIKADYEQKCYELDKKFIESASRLDSESAQNERATAKCNELEKELGDLRTLYKNLENNMHDYEKENLSLRRIKDNWDEDKLNLQHIIEKRDLEIARLNDEWKEQSERMLEATNAKNELQVKLDETTSSEVTSHYHMKRVEQEKELLSEQNTQLSEDLSQKSQQFLAFQKEKQDELISLQSQLELANSESKQLKELFETLKKNEDSMNEKMNELNDKYNKATEEYHSMEEMHRNELQSQSRLAQLYKDSSEDAEKKSEELVSAVEELQALIKANSEEMEDLKKQLAESKNETHELFKETEKLKKELEEANDLIMANKRRELSDEELTELCPTAALTSKFLKSGMTLTQIYAQYVEQADELIVAKEENKRLNEAMDSILQELNAKAPLLKRQREDYERALVTINQLTTQTDEAAIEFQQVRQEADDSLRRSDMLKRENEKLHKEMADLSKQVCFLVREVEELRGRQILMSPPKKDEGKSLLVVNDDGSCNDVSSSSELISQTLVTFKDIAELQEQNQKLLAVIRQLSEEQEAAEKNEIDEKTQKIQHELEMATEELERLRDDRTRQMTLVETIVRQRDMYRVLLAQNPEGGVPPSVLASPSLLGNTSWTSTTSTPATPTVRTPAKSPRTPDIGLGESARKALAQLQEEYTDYKKEVLNNNKVFDEKITSLQDELLAQKGACAKLDAQLEFSKERYNIMKNSIDTNKKEADALRNRNQQLYTVIQQHERNVGNLSVDLAEMRETNSKLQARLDTSQRELEIVKRTEDRLSSENSSLQREHRNQMVLLGNLQKMQQSMEAQAFEVKTQLNTRIEAQDREIKSLRQNSHTVAQSKQDEIQRVEKQLYVVQKQYDSEQLKTVKLTHDLANLKNEMEIVERERNDAKAKLSSVEERLSRISGASQSVDDSTGASDDQDTIRVLRQEIREKSQEIIGLELRLEKLKQHADHFREVSVAAEESLKQSNDANKQLLESLQQRLEHSSQQVVNLEQAVIKVEEENNLLKNEKYRVTGNVEKQTADLRKELAVVQADLEKSLRRRDEAVKNEQIAIEDLKQQVSKAEQANDNYQREMMLHASAMKQLLDLKEKVKNFDNEMEKEKNRSLQLEEKLKEREESWSGLEGRLRSETEQQKQRYSDIEEQNKILHNQIQALSGRLLELQSKQATHTPRKSLYASRDPVAVATAAVESGDFNSNQQLLDVIKFLRREKEIADTKSELIQSEMSRCRQQILQLEKQISETQDKIEAEQKRAVAAEEQILQLNSLKREISILKSVEDQNKLLRAERDQLDEDLRSANNRVTRIQEDVAPLQSKNRELSAQNTAMQAEKKALSEETERWKERVQQMTQSPRRQDPEEYRRLIQEKSTLSGKVDSLNKELAELKTENSNLKGQIRALESNLQSTNTSILKFEDEIKSKDEAISRAKAEIEEKKETANKIRRVGRRFKQQYEELLAKQQKIDAEKKAQEENPVEQAPSSLDAKKVEETEESLKQAEANLSEERARLQALSQELSRSQEENKNLKSEKEEISKKLEKVIQSQSELQGENVALHSQSEEKSKSLKDMTKQVEDLQKEKSEMNEKEKKFTRLLQLARQQLEKLRKESQENGKIRESLQEDLRKLESEKKAEVEQKVELQAKVEELQSQLNDLKSASVVQSTERKAAAVRPTSAQQVNQVKPMRVTRTARVMPEPQQEAQDADRPGSSSATQPASSSTQAAASVPTALPVSSQVTTVFVHPMSPARQQQQSVGSSVSSGQSGPSDEVRSGGAPGDVASEGGEVDNIVSSSVVDQPLLEESTTSASGSSSALATASVPEGEASSSSTPRFVAPSSSAVPPSLAAGQTRPFGAGQKRSHEDADDSSRPGSSREAQVAVAPIAKRQRPDQSSESVSVVTPSSGSVQTEPVASGPEASVSSAARQPDQSQQSDPGNVDENIEETPDAEHADSEAPIELDPVQESHLVGAEASQSDYVVDQSEVTTQQGVASSSVEYEDRVIILSSDDEEEGLDPEEEEDINDEANECDEEENEDEEMVAERESPTPSTTRPEFPPFSQAQTVHPSGHLPSLILPQDAPARSRLTSRPAPLTPGIIFPPSTDDDSIVPCTPTLVTHRGDDSYHAVSSPRVPPASTIRFQFEDVTQTPTSLAAMPGGLASVDNTIMDLTGAGGDESSRSVPIVSSSSTSASFSGVRLAVTARDAQPSGTISGSAAVSSSIQEELEEVDETDQAISSNVVETSNEARSSIPSQSVRGRRRLRVIGAPRPPRVKGVNSPSTSNQS